MIPLALIKNASPGISQWRSRTFHLSASLDKSLKAKYREFWTPKVTEPPYQHAVQVGDPVLRRKCDPVPAEGFGSPEIKFLISLMTNVMQKYKCVGLAAPQIGIPLRVIALEFKEAYKKDFAPQVIQTRNMQELPLTVSGSCTNKNAVVRHSSHSRESNYIRMGHNYVEKAGTHGRVTD